MLVGIAQVGYGNSSFKVSIGDANNGYSNNIVEVLVIGMDEVAVGFDANNGNYATKGKLDMSKVWCRFGEELSKELT